MTDERAEPARHAVATAATVATPWVARATGNEVAQKTGDAQQSGSARIVGAGALPLNELSALDPHELALLAALGC
jgi:hypothetical protein